MREENSEMAVAVGGRAGGSALLCCDRSAYDVGRSIGQKQKQRR